MVPQELLDALHSYSIKNKSDKVDIRQFVSATRPKMGEAELEAALRELAAKGECVALPADGAVKVVSFPNYHLFLLEDEYKTLSVEASRPFPREDTFPAKIPPSEILTIDVKNEFSSLLAGKAGAGESVAKLVFPEDLDSLIVPVAIASTGLVEASVVKLSSYLSDAKNAGYAESKLVSIFKGNDVLVRQLVEDAALRPKKAAEGVFSPTDFSFRFWTYLVNLVLQDFRKKKEKTVQDQGICQSAYILGYYAFFTKGQAQKEAERAADRKTLELLVRKPPYVFTFEELYALTDEKGIPFVTKHTHQFIHSFLEEKTRRVGQEGLPFIVRIHDSTRNKDYFIQKDLIVPVFLKKLSEASEEMRDQYMEDWVGALRRHENPPVMKNDDAFRKDVEARVKEGYPLLSALAHAPLLYLAKAEGNPSAEALEEIRRCFRSDNALRPLSELMGLFRQLIYNEARSYLPIWETMPILRQIVAFFRRIFSGRARARSESAAESAVRPSPALRREGEGELPAPRRPARTSAVAEKAAAALDRDDQARYRKAIQLLRDRFVPLGRDIEYALDELSEAWNPLYAEAPKRELVEDVNALVRDFLRPVKRTLLTAPPTAQRIQSLAEQLSASKSLSKIRKKEPLKRYIELYMIKSLEPKKKL
jgi:hypothetical protein